MRCMLKLVVKRVGIFKTATPNSGQLDTKFYKLELYITLFFAYVKSARFAAIHQGTLVLSMPMKCQGFVIYDLFFLDIPSTFL